MVTTLPITDAMAAAVSPVPSKEGRMLRITDRTLTVDDMLQFAGRTGYTGQLRVEASVTGVLHLDGGRPHWRREDADQRLRGCGRARPQR